jgi:hypothetical protein
MCRLYSREQPGSSNSRFLFTAWQVIKFTARIRLASRVLILSKDTNSAADGFSSGLSLPLTKQRHALSQQIKLMKSTDNLKSVQTQKWKHPLQKVQS